MGERVEAVKRDTKSGKLQCVLATTYVQLAGSVRDQWLDDAITSLHVTPIGLCAKDFGSARCEYQVNCFNACEHHLVQITDPKTRQQVVELKCRNEEVVRLNEERAAREAMRSRPSGARSMSRRSRTWTTCSRPHPTTQGTSVRRKARRRASLGWIVQNLWNHA